MKILAPKSNNTKITKPLPELKITSISLYKNQY